MGPTAGKSEPLVYFGEGGFVRGHFGRALEKALFPVRESSREKSAPDVVAGGGWGLGRDGSHSNYLGRQ